MWRVSAMLCITLHCFGMDFPEPMKRLIKSPLDYVPCPVRIFSPFLSYGIVWHDIVSQVFLCLRCVVYFRPRVGEGNFCFKSISNCLMIKLSPQFYCAFCYDTIGIFALWIFVHARFKIFYSNSVLLCCDNRHMDVSYVPWIFLRAWDSAIGQSFYCSSVLKRFLWLFSNLKVFRVSFHACLDTILMKYCICWNELYCKSFRLMDVSGCDVISHWYQLITMQ